MTERRRCVGAAAVGLLAMVLCGCGSETDGGAGGAGGQGGSAVALPFKDSTCAPCLATYCPGEITACKGDPECAGFLSCLNSCPTAESGGPDAECEATCLVPTSTEGRSAHKQYQACRTSETIKQACSGCPDAAPDSTVLCLDQGTCPADAGANEETACKKCTAERCCEIKAVTEANPEKDLLFDCWDTCLTDDCYYECDQMHPDGLADVASLLVCMLHLCVAECAYEEVQPATACHLCTFRQCGAEFAEAQCGQADSLLLQDCAASCGQDVTCEEACHGEYPEQVERELAHIECVDQCSDC